MRKNGAIAHGVHFELEVSKKRQNTDPFVFGDTFYYTCCQRKRLFGPEKGDIILFGSCKNGKVLIDTVFVVDNPKLEVDDEFKKRNPIFYETVIIPMKNREGCGCADNAGTVNNVVTGAMYYKGDYPYSFIPFKKSDGKSYHERLEIRKQDYEKYFSGFKIRFNNQGIGYVKTDDKNDVNKFWHTLKEYCEKEGYCLGVHISLPTEVKSNTLDEFLK